VHVHLAAGAFHALVHQPVEKGAAVVAKGGAAIAVQTELVLVSGVIRLGALPSAWTLEGHKFVASSMNHKAADLTLQALFSNPPDEVGAVAAKGWLLEEAGGELVALDFVDHLLPQSPLSAKQGPGSPL